MYMIEEYSSKDLDHLGIVPAMSGVRPASLQDGRVSAKCHLSSDF
jgi:hypothetical protein